MTPSTERKRTAAALRGRAPRRSSSRSLRHGYRIGVFVTGLLFIALGVALARLDLVAKATDAAGL